MYRALRGENPKISFQELSLETFKNIWKESTIDENKKIPLILSHIPFLGTYLVYRHGEVFASGEKFSNWIFIGAALAFWIDPSRWLFIITIALATLWVVFQSIVVASGENMRLIGHLFPGNRKCHIYLRSIYSYIKLLFDHDSAMPLWKEILHDEEMRFIETQNTHSTVRMAIPIINIPTIWYTQKKSTSEIIDAIIVNILFLYACISIHVPLLMILTLYIWWAYWQTRNNKPASILLITEISLCIVKFIAWRNEKSKPLTENNHL
jgi:hypothetical protein